MIGRVVRSVLQHDFRGARRPDPHERRPDRVDRIAELHVDRIVRQRVVLRPQPHPQVIGRAADRGERLSRSSSSALASAGEIFAAPASGFESALIRPRPSRRRYCQLPWMFAARRVRRPQHEGRRAGGGGGGGGAGGREAPRSARSSSGSPSSSRRSASSRSCRGVSVGSVKLWYCGRSRRVVGPRFWFAANSGGVGIGAEVDVVDVRPRTAVPHELQAGRRHADRAVAPALIAGLSGGSGMNGRRLRDAGRMVLFHLRSN